MNLDFLQVHSLAHKFQYGHYSNAERRDLALKALRIMTKFNAVHPFAKKYIVFLKETGDPASSEYTEEWALQIKASAAIPLYLSEDDVSGIPPKEAVFEEFVTLYQQKFIEGDFGLVPYYITRMATMVQFPINCIGAEQFIRNRFFEYLFYQVISIVHGPLWRQSCNKAGKPGHDMNADEKLMQFEKKLKLYYDRSTYLLKSLGECAVEVADGVNAEFAYYNLSLWYLAISRFSRNRFDAFVSDFERLYPHFESVIELDMKSEVLSMYAVASIACKPFKELVINSSESLFERFTNGSGVEQQLHNVMYSLAHADFVQAKRVLNNTFYDSANAIIGYSLPRKPDGFWTYWSDVIDLKGFLLLMSVTRRIPRMLLVQKLGYTDCTPDEYASISDKLIVLMSVLLLGSVGITYDEKSDVFVQDSSQPKVVERISQQLEEVDHTSRANAAAQLLRGMLVEKYF